MSAVALAKAELPSTRSRTARSHLRPCAGAARPGARSSDALLLSTGAEQQPTGPRRDTARHAGGRRVHDLIPHGRRRSARRGLQNPGCNPRDMWRRHRRAAQRGRGGVARNVRRENGRTGRIDVNDRPEIRKRRSRIASGTRSHGDRFTDPGRRGVNTRIVAGYLWTSTRHPSDLEKYDVHLHQLEPQW